MAVSMTLLSRPNKVILKVIKTETPKMIPVTVLKIKEFCFIMLDADGISDSVRTKEQLDLSLH